MQGGSFRLLVSLNVNVSTMFKGGQVVDLEIGGEGFGEAPRDRHPVVIYGFRVEGLAYTSTKVLEQLHMLRNVLGDISLEVFLEIAFLGVGVGSDGVAKGLVELLVEVWAFEELIVEGHVRVPLNLKD